MPQVSHPILDLEGQLQLTIVNGNGIFAERGGSYMLLASNALVWIINQ